MASLIEECVLSYGSLIELPWEQQETLQALVRPSKLGLLNQYIYAMISTESRSDFRKNADIYEDLYDRDEDQPSFNDPIQTDFIAYGIKFEPFTSFISRMRLDEDTAWFYQWFQCHEPQFEDLWEILADEVFHILFANRTFLLNFNQALAQFLQSGRVSIPAEYLDKKGVIARASHVPAWLKKAVFYRDHGRCVICQKDLSGLLSTDRYLHYDHIVPLNMWGTNDPSNFQLLCNECNLRKSGSIIKTAYRYPAWWDY